MKLSKTMQEALDKMIHSPYADYGPGSCMFYMNDGFPHTRPSEGKYADGTIKTRNVTTTIKALEARGLIEILDIGGAWGRDTVRLLKHENTSRPIFETNNMIEVELYLHGPNGREYKDDGRHYVEDGNVENAKKYWDNVPARYNISRMVNKETGEEIYNSTR